MHSHAFKYHFVSQVWVDVMFDLFKSKCQLSVYLLVTDPTILLLLYLGLHLYNWTLSLQTKCHLQELIKLSALVPQKLDDTNNFNIATRVPYLFFFFLNISFFSKMNEWMSTILVLVFFFNTSYFSKFIYFCLTKNFEIRQYCDNVMKYNELERKNKESNFEDYHRGVFSNALSYNFIRLYMQHDLPLVRGIGSFDIFWQYFH